MSRRPKRKTAPVAQSVTQAELGVLEALWETGAVGETAATVRQLADRIYPGGTATEYATVQKLLQRLKDKGWVRRVRGRSPIEFVARMGRDALVARHVEDVVDRLCAGSITPLLTHLARRELTAGDRAQLEAFLDDLEKRPRAKRRRKR